MKLTKSKIETYEKTFGIVLTFESEKSSVEIKVIIK